MFVRLSECRQAIQQCEAGAGDVNENCFETEWSLKELRCPVTSMVLLNRQYGNRPWREGLRMIRLLNNLIKYRERFVKDQGVV